MPGRRVFFSFHYELDVWRATIVRNSGKVDASAAAGLNDASVREEAKRRGDRQIERLIEQGLERTSVTAVLIGQETASRRWVTHEIHRSVARGNGLLGVRIHRLKNHRGERGRRGAVPEALLAAGAPVYDWDPDSSGRWVEWAAIAADKLCLRHRSANCFSCRCHWWS